MSRHELELPVLQNWSCHNCSGCCRQHQIEITAEERRRIEHQNWTAEDGIPAGQPLFQSLGPKWNRRSALAHQADGACVFLNEDGLCRIHAKFGEAAKPLACRVYPYAFHPDGKKVDGEPAVQLPFGGRQPRQAATWRTPANSKSWHRWWCPLRPANFRRRASIPASKSVGRTFINSPKPSMNTLADEEAGIGIKLCRALGWLQLVEAAQFEKIQGGRLTEFLELIIEATAAEVDATLGGRPSRANRAARGGCTFGCSSPSMPARTPRPMWLPVGEADCGC